MGCRDTVVDVVAVVAVAAIAVEVAVAVVPCCLIAGLSTVVVVVVAALRLRFLGAFPCPFALRDSSATLSASICSFVRLGFRVRPSL